jgi:hypothetical protein
MTTAEESVVVAASDEADEPQAVRPATAKTTKSLYIKYSIKRIFENMIRVFP